MHKSERAETDCVHTRVTKRGADRFGAPLLKCPDFPRSAISCALATVGEPTLGPPPEVAESPEFPPPPHWLEKFPPARRPCSLRPPAFRRATAPRQSPLPFRG